MPCVRLRIASCWTFLAAAVCAVAGPARADVLRAGEATVTNGVILDHTWNHIVPAGGRDRFLLVAVSIDHDLSRVPEVQSLTAAGMPMRRLLAHANPMHARVELWGLTAPPEGAITVSIRLSSPAGFLAGAISFTGVAQDVSIGDVAMGSGLAAMTSLALDAAPGELIVDTYASDGTAIPEGGAGQAVQWARRARVVGSASVLGGPTAGPLVWRTPGVDQDFAHAAVVLRAAPPPPDGGLVDAAPTPDAAPAVDGPDGVDGASADAAGPELDGPPGMTDAAGTDAAGRDGPAGGRDGGLRDGAAPDAAAGGQGGRGGNQGNRPDGGLAGAGGASGGAGGRAGSGGTPGSVADGGAAGAGPEVDGGAGPADAGSGADAGGAAPVELEVGCACRLGASGAPGAAVPLLFVGGVALVWRRRRR